MSRHSLDRLVVLLGFVQPPERAEIVAEVQPGVALDLGVGRVHLERRLLRLLIPFDRSLVVLKLAVHPPNRVQGARLDQRFAGAIADRKGLVQAVKRLRVFALPGPPKRLAPYPAGLREDPALQSAPPPLQI